jgi:hypothetical protein
LAARFVREPDAAVARVLDEDELVGNWTLVGDELDPRPHPTESALSGAMLCGDDYRDGIAPHTDW